MKKILFLILAFSFSYSFAQQNDTIVYKKRVLESTEVDFLLSYYKQDGVHSAVSGGMGSGFNRHCFQYSCFSSYE